MGSGQYPFFSASFSSTQGSVSTSSKGKLFVIAGSDGSGKATQTALLADALRKNHYLVAVYDFPTYTSFYGTMIADYLTGKYGDATAISPYLASLLYALDRKEQLPAIQADLARGAIVLCNRYVESNIAHQAIKLPKKKQQAFIDWLLYLEYEYFSLPKPACTFFLYVPYTFAAKMVLKKAARRYLAGKKKDMHEANLEHQKKAEAMYLSLAKQPGWVRIDCIHRGRLRSKEDIHRQLLGHLLSYLS
ncbi:MAG: hypothetical protein QW594_02200 [Candidatus Woesearchaeota archaeon]